MRESLAWRPSQLTVDNKREWLAWRSSQLTVDNTVIVTMLSHIVAIVTTW